MDITPSSAKRAARQRRLIQLLEERFDGKQAALADCAEISATLISRYVTGSKGIGEDMSEKIETACGLPRYWLDGEGAHSSARSPEPLDHPDAASLVKAVHAVDEVLATDGITLEYDKYLDLITYVADRLRKNETEENIGLSRLIKLLL